MRRLLPPLSAAVLLALSPCGRKADAKSQLSELKKVFETAQPPVQTERPASDQAFIAEATAYVSLALSAVRTNDYAGGVIALQAVQRMPGMTSQQLMAVQGAMQAMTAELLVRASKGDAKARSDLAAIERTRSQ